VFSFSIHNVRTRQGLSAAKAPRRSSVAIANVVDVLARLARHFPVQPRQCFSAHARVFREYILLSCTLEKTLYWSDCILCCRVPLRYGTRGHCPCRAFPEIRVYCERTYSTRAYFQEYVLRGRIYSMLSMCQFRTLQCSASSAFMFVSMGFREHILRARTHSVLDVLTRPARHFAVKVQCLP